VGLVDDLGKIAPRLASGDASEADVQAADHQTARPIPQSSRTAALVKTIGAGALALLMSTRLSSRR
jgi:hypothetical protein